MKCRNTPAPNPTRAGAVRRRLSAAILFMLSTVTLAAYQQSILVVPSYRIVEEPYEIRVSYNGTTDTYTAVYQAHNVIREWDTGRADEVEESISQTTEEFTGLSPYAPGVHTVASRVLATQPAEYATFTVGDDDTVAADALPAVDPTGPGLAQAQDEVTDLGGASAVLVSAEDQMLRDTETALIEQISDASSLVDEASEIANEQTMGDPVLVASGKFTTSETDLGWFAGDVPIVIRRVHRTNAGTSGSIGSAWWLSVDTRIVLGQSDGAAAASAVAANNASSIRTRDVASLSSIYSASRELINGYLASAGAQLAQAEETHDGLILAKLTYHGDHRDVVLDEINRQLSIAASRVAGWRAVVAEFDASLVDLRTAYGTTGSGALGELYAAAARHDAAADHYAREAKWTQDNAERNDAYVPGLPGEHDPHREGDAVLASRSAGNDSVTLIDERGFLHRYSYAMTPDLSGTHTFSDGSPNFFPAGSELIPQSPTDVSLRLAPDGIFEARHRDGTRWFYGRFGQLQRIVDRNGNRAEFAYDAQGQLQSITDNTGRIVRLDRSDDGTITVIHGPVATSVTYEYTPGGELLSVTDPAGDTVRFTYNGTALTRITKPDGSYRSYRYDTVRGTLRTVRTTDEEGGVETYNFDSPGLTVHTDASGVVTIHRYDPSGRTIRSDHGSGLYETFAYDSNGNLIARRQTDGGVYRFTYDARGNLIRKDHPDGSTETWSYNRFDLPVTAVNRMGNRTVYEYDGNGNLVRKIFPDGTSDSYSYAVSGTPAAGRVEQHVDRRGNATVATYDEHGYLLSLCDSIGPIGSYRHDALGRLTSQTDGLGHETRLSYSPDGMLVSIEGPEGFEAAFTYDGRKDLVHVETNGRELDYGFDNRHLPVRVVNALGERIEYRYRDDGRPLSRTVLSADGLVAHLSRYGYDDRGLLAEVTHPAISATTLYERDALGRIRTQIDPEGHRTEYQYSADGYLIARTRYDGNRPVRESYAYYPDGVLRRHTDALGRTTIWIHDPVARILTRVDPTGSHWESRYDPYGGVVRETDPNGSSIYREFDLRGRLVAIRNDDFVIARYQYDAANRLATFTDGEGATWRFAYDGLARLLSVTHPDGARREYRYNADGTIAAWTDETGVTTIREYDVLGRVVAEVTAGNRTEFVWDTLGALTCVTDPSGRSASFRFDAGGRLRGVEDGAGGTTTYERDRLGRVVATVDPTMRQTGYLYDDLGRLSQVLVAGEPVARFGYDDVGNLVEVRDGADVPARMSYDARDLLIAETSRAGDNRTYEYDAAGRMIRITNEAGRRTIVSYDLAGRPTDVVYDDGTYFRYTYDRTGRMTAAENQDGHLAFRYTPRGLLREVIDPTFSQELEYDPAGRLAALTESPSGRRTEYRYDAGFLSDVRDSVLGHFVFEHDRAGRLTGLTAPGGIVTTRAYDDAGRLSCISVRNPALHGPILFGAAWVYDAAGRRTYEVDHRGGVTEYDYDARARVARASYPFSGAKRLEDYASFALAGVVPAIPPGDAAQAGFSPGPELAAPGGTAYSRPLHLASEDAEAVLDAYHRIIPLRKGDVDLAQTVWTEEFEYDDANNRSVWRTGWGAIRYTYDSTGRLERASGAIYDYDPMGNLVAKADANGPLRYTYGGAGRLSTVTSPSATVHYAYDALGRRSSRVETVVPAFAPTSPLLRKQVGAQMRTTLLHYLGLTLAVRNRVEIEQFGIVDTTSLRKEPAEPGGRYRPLPVSPGAPAGNETTRLSWAELTVPVAGIDIPLSLGSIGGAVNLVHGPLGSIRAETDQSGRLTTESIYDAFGTRLPAGMAPESLQPVAPAITTSQPYGFASRAVDAATGFSDFGYRDYDPAVGRFTTPDPVRDGINPYAYGGNDPVNRIDVWGLAPRNLDEAARLAYKRYVATYAGTSASIPTYQSGPRAGQQWDCADLATYIATGAVEAATGVEYYYRNLTAGGAPLASIPEIHSSDFATAGNVSFYRTPDGEIDNAFASPNVEAGTIGVFTNHIITVTADRAAPTDPIQTIQGHLEDPVDWPPIDGSTTLDLYSGDFVGWAEIGPGSTPVPSSSQFAAETKCQ